MDPNETIKTIREAWSQSDFETMRVAVHDLRLWLDKGGFMPDVDADTLNILLTIIEEPPN